MKKPSFLQNIAFITLGTLPSLACAADPALQWRSGIDKCFGRWGYQKYAECEHENHGVQNYRLARHEKCGVESYQAGTHADFGVKTYKLGRGAACGVENHKEGWIANGIPCSSISNYISTQLLGKSGIAIYSRHIYCHSAIDQEKREICRTSDVRSEKSNDEYIQNKLCQPFFVKERHEKFGVETYKECRHEDFGVEEYTTQPDARFGIASHKECRIPENGIESYQKKRSQNCNEGTPDADVFLTELFNYATNNPFFGDENPAFKSSAPATSLFCSTGDHLPANTTQEVSTKFEFLKSRYLASKSIEGHKHPISDRELSEVVAMIKELGMQKGTDLSEDQMNFVFELETEFPDTRF